MSNRVLRRQSTVPDRESRMVIAVFAAARRLGECNCSSGSGKVRTVALERVHSWAFGSLGESGSLQVCTSISASPVVP